MRKLMTTPKGIPIVPLCLWITFVIGPTLNAQVVTSSRPMEQMAFESSQSALATSSIETEDLPTVDLEDAWYQAAQRENVKAAATSSDAFTEDLSNSLSSGIGVGYDNGFLIASKQDTKLNADNYSYLMRINGFAQLRDTLFESRGVGRDLNQLQLKRARIIFSGHAFNPDVQYFVQLDGRSNSGDTLRILDYSLTYDIGHRNWGLDQGTVSFKTGLYKMPFSRARYASGKQLEFADRSMASMFFDVNRSLAWGLSGRTNSWNTPVNWEVALFNGLVTGGAETGSSGNLDNNNAVSGRFFSFPTGTWEEGEFADFTNHESIATRIGAGFAFTTIDSSGPTEFNALRTVDSGQQLSTLLPGSVDQYAVSLYSVDAAMKLLGCSLTYEYYFRNVSGFRGADLPDLFDHGFWLQSGVFVIPRKLELLARWSRVQGNSGSLGVSNLSSEEIAGGTVWYFKDQHSKLTFDATYLNGAAINSSTLDISAGDRGWLFRTQLQFSF